MLSGVMWCRGWRNWVAPLSLPRHVQLVAGLGSLGLSDGLITPVGKAMRCGSVVTNIRLEPTPRTFRTHTDYCLSHARGICRACMKRCPAGAITERGHDKATCLAYIRGKREELLKDYDVQIGGCGLCQTGVPCEAGAPRPGDG